MGADSRNSFNFHSILFSWSNALPANVTNPFLHQEAVLHVSTQLRRFHSHV